MPFNDNLPAENTDPWYLPFKAAWDNLKAFVNGLETTLGTKASSSDLSTGLATKVNTSTYTSGMAGKADTVHTHAAADIVSGALNLARIPSIPPSKMDATGTPSNVTYLRGDGTWSTPAGGGGGAVDSVNGQVGTVELDAADVGARPDTWTPTAADVGAVPTTRTINGEPLSANVVLDATDVGARDSAWVPAWTDVTSKPSTFAPTIGSTGTTAVAGNDARLTDQRVPTPNSVDNTKVADGALSIAKTNGLQGALDGKARAESTNAGLWIGTNAAYTAIVTKNAATLYVTTD